MLISVITKLSGGMPSPSSFSGRAVRSVKTSLIDMDPRTATTMLEVL